MRSMVSTDDFDTDWEQVREKLGWLISRQDSDEKGRAAIIEAILGEVRDFLERWGDRPPDGYEQGMLAKLREIADWLEQRQHIRFSAELRRVISFRISCGVAEYEFKCGLETSSVYKAMSPEQQREFQARRVTPYDPTIAFRQNEALINKFWKAYKQALVKLTCDWPRRVDDVLKQRLAREDLVDLSDWEEALYAVTSDYEQALEQKGA